jgi:hypothetical protein
VAASTQLADELLAATESRQFAANALALQGLFNSTILPFETQYFAATAAGVLAHCAAMRKFADVGHGVLHAQESSPSGMCRGSPCLTCSHVCCYVAGTSSKYPQLPAWAAPAVYNYSQAVEIDGQVRASQLACTLSFVSLLPMSMTGQPHASD